jgi:uncharacterized protein YbbC (DUF1343 family)
VVDDEAFRPFECYLAILAAAREVGGGVFGWRTETYEFESERLAIDLLFGNDWLRRGLETGVGWRELAERWGPDVERFRREREAFLLYR